MLEEIVLPTRWEIQLDACKEEGSTGRSNFRTILGSVQLLVVDKNETLQRI
jgi:hypothetical protein